jgi:CBS domain-containing protein
MDNGGLESMIKITEYMTKPVITVKPTDSIRDAVIKMDHYNIGSVIVADKDKKPQGIMTERDIMRKAIAKGIDLDKTTVDKIMTKKIETVTETATLIEIASLMKTHTMRRIVVVNKKGEVSGIVTSKDLIDILCT